MAAPGTNVSPKNFFLNEKHELARGEKQGGGRVPEYVGVHWQSKGLKISKSLFKVRDQVAKMRDPLRATRYFVLARPEVQLTKKSEDKRNAATGKKLEAVAYSEGDSRAFGRLGMDLIQVNRDGTATVHARPELIEQLAHSAEMLADFGKREQARWATIESFDIVPPEFVVDQQWVDGIQPKSIVDTVIELQPLLTGLESDQVVRSVVDFLRRQAGEAVRGMGTDFSGRRWLRAKLYRETLFNLAKSFFSIQSIHPPLFALFAGPPPKRVVSLATVQKPPIINIRDLPCVAVVDTGVPSDHKYLAPYLRGKYVAPTVGAPFLGSHGTFVSSRVVFGDVDCSSGTPGSLTPECAVYDVNIAATDDRTDEKAVIPALEAIVGVAPDVRVFNFSFDNLRPLDQELPIERQEKLRLVQDLDNFIFARDVMVIVAAGNSPRNVQPMTPYPRHMDDPNWALGTWPQSFNALTCGSFALLPSGEALAQEDGAPSPFTKVGPGLCGSPKPDLSEHGGNGNASYNFQPGMGVGGCSEAGYWEDRAGTSFAAPLLARQAAMTFQLLQKFCEPGMRPFAVMVKAYLILTATQRELSAPLRPLADLTLGKGRASSQWLQKPKADRAMFLWQGVLDNPAEVARVQLPIPKTWLQNATQPRLRLVVSWDPPVNAAVSDLWASRKVSAQLRVRLDTKALHSSRTGHKTYPLIDRTYDLDKLPEGVTLQDDSWLLELAYEQIAEYYLGIAFAPQQRVAVAAELFDEAETPISPQSFLQSLPIAPTMNRFSVGTQVVRNPIALKNRV